MRKVKMARQVKKSLGESLVEEGIITQDQLKQAKAEEKKPVERKEEKKPEAKKEKKHAGKVKKKVAVKKVKKKVGKKKEVKKA